uniref:DRBM domain-containing protein n=1 Tax=Schistosoma mansoni TaxID=6183 RepID=A0A3Q0KPN5_SCHMA
MSFDSKTFINISPVFVLNKQAHLLKIDLSWTCEESGPFHNKVFRVSVIINHHSLKSSEIYYGVGSSVKEARRMAAESALQTCILFKYNAGSSNEDLQTGGQFIIPRNANPFIILINSDPTSLAPKVQLRQLLNLLGSKVKFVHSVDDANNSFHPIMYRTTAEIVGRQYVGNSTTKSGAEQESCLSALMALRRSLLSYIKTQKLRKKEQNDHDDVYIYRCIRPKSSVWRLRILAGLHFIQPFFKIQKLTNCEPNKFTCICLLDGWKYTENRSISAKKAQNAAAQSMLNNMNKIENKCSTVPFYDKQYDVTSKGVYKQNHKPCKIKLQLIQHRAFDESVHPVCRLEYFRIVNNLDKVKYTLLNDQLPSGEHKSLAPGRPPFIYQLEFSNMCIQGPVANNKRLAKRLAAELLLTKLGLSNEKSSNVKSVLRSTVIESLNSNTHDIKSVSENLSCGLVPEIISKVHKSLSPTEKSEDQSQDTISNEEHHVNFSCTSDTLIFDEELVDPVLLREKTCSLKRKDIQSKTIRNSSIPRSHSSINLSVSETNNLLQNYSPTSTDLSLINSVFETKKSNNLDVFSKTIGYWIDSKKSKSNQKSCARSHSEVDFTEGSHWYQKFGGIYNNTSPDIITDFTRSKSNIRLHLLARVAEYCLQEHTPNNSIHKMNEYHTSQVTSLTDQLVFLCRRLLVPCHFIEYPPKLNVVCKSEKEFNTKYSYAYTVILFVGINPMKEISIHNNDYITVKATDLTRNSARQKATQSVLKCLTQLI